jgi:hypothetical protein
VPIADFATNSCGVCFASAFGGYKLLIAGIRIVMAGRVLMAIILIVEDDSFIRETAEMMIQDLGQRWSRFSGQNGGLAKVDSGFGYAANFSSFACVA